MSSATSAKGSSTGASGRRSGRTTTRTFAEPGRPNRTSSPSAAETQAPGQSCDALAQPGSPPIAKPPPKCGPNTARSPSPSTTVTTRAASASGATSASVAAGTSPDDANPIPQRIARSRSAGSSRPVPAPPASPPPTQPPKQLQPQPTAGTTQPAKPLVSPVRSATLQQPVWNNSSKATPESSRPLAGRPPRKPVDAGNSAATGGNGIAAGAVTKGTAAAGATEAVPAVELHSTAESAPPATQTPATVKPKAPSSPAPAAKEAAAGAPAASRVAAHGAGKRTATCDVGSVTPCGAVGALQPAAAVVTGHKIPAGPVAAEASTLPASRAAAAVSGAQRVSTDGRPMETGSFGSEDQGSAGSSSSGGGAKEAQPVAAGGKAASGTGSKASGRAGPVLNPLEAEEAAAAPGCGCVVM